jgi:hypothetical protein
VHTGYPTVYTIGKRICTKKSTSHVESTCVCVRVYVSARARVCMCVYVRVCVCAGARASVRVYKAADVDDVHVEVQD